MSKLEETVYFIACIAEDSEIVAHQLVQCAEKLSRDYAALSSIFEGTNDSIVLTTKSSLTTAQKELYKAVKALIVAGKAGNDWCDGQSPNYQKKKVRR